MIKKEQIIELEITGMTHEGLIMIPEIKTDKTAKIS